MGIRIKVPLYSCANMRVCANNYFSIRVQIYKFNFFSHLLILVSVCFCNLLNHIVHLLFFIFAEQLRLLASIISFAK